MSQVEIPWHSLSEEALLGVIEEFVTREGTDYGPAVVDLEAKCAQVRRQLEKGEARITWDEASQSCTLVSSG